MRILTIVLLALLTAGCSSLQSSAPPQAQTRSYNGTASVGDFMTITLDIAAQTLSYTNLSNGDTGTVPYTLNADGTYTLNDPAGNLVAAYEIPGYAMLVAAEKTGADHATPSLITAVAESQVTIGTFENCAYNYMQFRTAAGGFEAGSATLDAQGDVSISSYWPYGATMQGSSPFNGGTMPGTNFSEDSSGTFIRMTDTGPGGAPSTDYVFGTSQGIFIVDTPNGAILSLKKAASKNFDPTYAGTYKALFYQKTGVTTGMNNVETGNPSLGDASMVIDAQGNVTVQSSQGNTVLAGTLMPVADVPYLYGSQGELTDPCYGLFTFRISTGQSQQDVFVSFLNRAVLFSSFRTALPLNPSNTYDYLYGVALK